MFDNIINAIILFMDECPKLCDKILGMFSKVQGQKKKF